MQRRPLGATGLSVSVLGLGAGSIGDPGLTESDAARLVHGAVDLGVTFIDTARSYGLSEERLGRHLGHRRGDVVLSTKVGYDIDGVADWTGEAVARGVDEALGRLATDVIDVVHLHSCDLATLEAGEVIDALDRARAAGKIRAVAYSGENDELDWALASRRFAVLQHSVSVFDQGAIDRVCAPAAAAGVGVIAKRPLANAPWRYAERPAGLEADKYWARYDAMAVDPGSLPWPELAVRFAAHAPGVTTAITGTTNLDHLAASVRAAESGPLDPARVEALRARFAAVGAGWPGII